MTDPNLTSITVILDRSGSMFRIDKKTVKGFNDFLAEQRRAPGEARVTLVRFNHEPVTDYLDLPLPAVENLITLNATGGTALLDAVGHTIDAMGVRFSDLPEHKRPGRVVVIIITDGEENSSQKFKAAEIRKKVMHQEQAYNWQFTFLGASLDAVAVAGELGVHGGNAAVYAVENMATTFSCLSSNISAYRSGGAMLSAYSDSQRASLASPEPTDAWTAVTRAALLARRALEGT